MTSILNVEHESVPVEQLTVHPDNPREGDVGAISRSIIENGGFWGDLVVQRSTGRILVGNHRYKAAAMLGFTHVPVAWVDVDDDQARRILIADNRANDLASYNDHALAELLTDLATSERSLDGTLYDGDDLDALIARLDSDGPQEGDADRSGGDGQSWSIVVDCVSEDEQLELLSEFDQRGLRCRAVIA